MRTRWPQTYCTRRGRTIQIRPIQPDDTDRMVDFLAHLSPETRYRRFHMPVPDPSREELLQRIGETVHLPPQRGLALVALFEDAIIGSARCVREDNGTVAEAAVVVRDDFQGEGIGSVLLSVLAHAARQMGITTLYAYIQPDNHRVIHLLRKAGLPTSTHLEGPLMRVEVDISAWTPPGSEVQSDNK